MNKVISIIRHAKSDWSHGCKDFDRALNERGYSDAQLMGKNLHDNKQLFNRVFCSAANRAQLTLQQLNSLLALPQANIQFESSLYLASHPQLVSFIEQVSNDYNHIALIGHNTGLTDLCNFLVGDRLTNLPTCAVYTIQTYVNDWKAIGPKCGTRTSLVTPRQLKDSHL
jgi:phosphohistidine phosphatase